MNDEAAFLRTILASPGDDAPWLVYADWLDERGRSAGPFIRGHLRELQALAVLLPRTWPAWIMQLVAPERDRHGIHVIGDVDPVAVAGAEDLAAAFKTAAVSDGTRPTADGTIGHRDGGSN